MPAPSFLLGLGPAPRSLAQGKTVGVVGAGRIGTAYARMMVEGHKMNLLYFSRSPNTWLEEYVRWVTNLLA